MRATGFDAGDYLIAGPGYSGEPGHAFKGVFRAETSIVGVLGRTELDGPEDVETVEDAAGALSPAAAQRLPGPSRAASRAPARVPARTTRRARVLTTSSAT